VLLRVASSATAIDVVRTTGSARDETEIKWRRSHEEVVCRRFSKLISRGADIDSAWVVIINAVKSSAILGTAIVV
jgi:hypothetical protein